MTAIRCCCERCAGEVTYTTLEAYFAVHERGTAPVVLEPEVTDSQSRHPSSRPPA